MKRIVILLSVVLVLCGCSNSSESLKDDKHISCVKMNELVINEHAILVDVRSEDEYLSGFLDDAINIPLDELADSIENGDLSEDDVIVVYCRSGNRSAQAKKLLEEHGFDKVYDLGAMTNCN